MSANKRIVMEQLKTLHETKQGHNEKKNELKNSLDNLTCLLKKLPEKDRRQVGNNFAKKVTPQELKEMKELARSSGGDDVADTIHLLITLMTTGTTMLAVGKELGWIGGGDKKTTADLKDTLLAQFITETQTAYQLVFNTLKLNARNVGEGAMPQKIDSNTPQIYNQNIANSKKNIALYQEITETLDKTTIMTPDAFLNGIQA